MSEVFKENKMRDKRDPVIILLADEEEQAK
jgi:hypothetical protein